MRQIMYSYCSAVLQKTTSLFVILHFISNKPPLLQPPCPSLTHSFVGPLHSRLLDMEEHE